MYKVEQNYDGFNDKTIPKVPQLLMSICRCLACIIGIQNRIPKFQLEVIKDNYNEGDEDHEESMERADHQNQVEVATIERVFPKICKKKRRNFRSNDNQQMNKSKKHLLTICKQQWTFVARVIDRCVFILYVFFFISSPIFFFFIYPAVYPHENAAFHGNNTL